MAHLIISVVIFNLAACFIPKNLTRDEMYSTSLLAGIFQLLVDIFLDVKYELYGYFEYGVDWLSLIPIFGIYPALNIIFLNYYPFSGEAMKKVIYIIGWAVFALVYEWSSVQAGWFYYNGWKLWYSALCYPAIYFILAKNLELLRNLKYRRR